MENALAGKRVLITQADAFMGPALCEVFAEQGAELVASASALRGMKRASTYSAARGVPLGRLVSAREDALFAAYLCSSAADCFVGQVFPVCGGWVGR
ncbi:MAG: hypothetical protein ACLGH1_03735 [Gammaproteobacteria bacterium]